MMPVDTVISVEGVSKKFCRSLKYTMLYGVRDVARDLFGVSGHANGLRPNEFWALDDVSFEVKRGECLGLIGPNGAGKSTLLKLLNGITLPDRGTIKVNGRVGALLELGAGFHPFLTGRENIRLNAAILGLTEEQINRKLEAIIDFAGLGEFIDSPVKHYSSGMYVRLGFAIAVHAEPDIVLVDEALAVGDSLFRSKCFAKFRDFKLQGVAVVFVTHDLGTVTSYCDRAFLLDHGILMKEGSPKVVVDQYNKLIVSKQGPDAPQISVAGIVGNSILSKQQDWQGLFRLNANEDRYGPRTAEILEAGIFNVTGGPVQALQRNNEYVIKVKVRHNESMPAAVIAFSIKDSRGTVLCGTNTLYQNVDMGWMDAGDVVVVTFKQVMRLNAGQYLLSLGCGSFRNGEYVVYDRRYDYMSLDIVSVEPRVGLFDPESLIEWARD